jgi:hypothetical protein
MKRAMGPTAAELDDVGRKISIIPLKIFNLRKEENKDVSTNTSGKLPKKLLT